MCAKTTANWGWRGSPTCVSPSCCLCMRVCVLLSVVVCVCYSVCIVGMSVFLSVCLEEDEQDEEHLVWLFGG